MTNDTTRNVDRLTDTVTHTHEALAERLATATACRPTADLPRARTAAADPFLAVTSRHVAAANAVLGRAVRQLPYGRSRSRELARCSHGLELALARTKARIYGSTYAATVPWATVWSDVGRELRQFQAIEQEIAWDIAANWTVDECDRLADRLEDAEDHVPTRPHPYLPHAGLPGRVARGVAVRVDRFWDTAEGRMVPPPARTPRPRDGRLAQYLLADPHVTDA